MKLSLREVTAKAVTAYTTQPRTQWVLNWPGQVVLASSTIHWTSEVQTALYYTVIAIQYYIINVSYYHHLHLLYAYV